MHTKKTILKHANKYSFHLIVKQINSLHFSHYDKIFYRFLSRIVTLILFLSKTNHVAHIAVPLEHKIQGTTPDWADYKTVCNSYNAVEPISISHNVIDPAD